MCPHNRRTLHDIGKIYMYNCVQVCISKYEGSSVKLRECLCKSYKPCTTISDQCLHT